MAARLREEHGIEATLVLGHGGVFVVRVGERVVAEKSPFGFPDEDDAIDAVVDALAEAAGG